MQDRRLGEALGREEAERSSLSSELQRSQDELRAARAEAEAASERIAREARKHAQLNGQVLVYCSRTNIGSFSPSSGIDP